QRERAGARDAHPAGGAAHLRAVREHLHRRGTAQPARVAVLCAVRAFVPELVAVDAAAARRKGDDEIGRLAVGLVIDDENVIPRARVHTALHERVARLPFRDRDGAVEVEPAAIALDGSGYGSAEGERA